MHQPNSLIPVLRCARMCRWRSSRPCCHCLPFPACDLSPLHGFRKGKDHAPPFLYLARTRCFWERLVVAQDSEVTDSWRCLVSSPTQGTSQRANAPDHPLGPSSTGACQEGAGCGNRSVGATLVRRRLPRGPEGAATTSLRPRGRSRGAHGATARRAPAG